MIQPKPFKKVCDKCGWSKVYHPKSDTFDPTWGLETKCPKCGKDLRQTSDIGGLDTIASSLKNMFR